MNSRPILMSSPMVRALLDGRKTQTRRVVKPQPAYGYYYEINGSQNAALHMARGESGNAIYVPPKPNSKDHRLACPYGQPGDLLWVRETWAKALGSGFVSPLDRYEADNGDKWGSGAIYKATPHPDYSCKRWKSSIHMPRWASRLTLELTGVRVERLQDISEADAMAEGIEPVLTGAGERCGWLGYGHKGAGTGYFLEAVNSYDSLWESINGPGSWDANPWVWVLGFTVHNCNVDELLSVGAA